MFNQKNEFLDSLASNSFIPLILQPTRITSHSNTLIDNIFSNVIDPDLISGNLTATISDHLPQFSMIPNMFGKMKFKSKPWITLGLQKSISVKNKLLKNFSSKKEPVLKEEFRTNYKTYSQKLTLHLYKEK